MLDEKKISELEADLLELWSNHTFRPERIFGTLGRIRKAPALSELFAGFLLLHSSRPDDTVVCWDRSGVSIVGQEKEGAD